MTAEVIEGPYLKDILAQPTALAATHEWLCDERRWHAARALIQQQRWSRIVLTGMGSSFHALHPLHLSLIAASQPSLMIETSELVYYGTALCDPHTLLIVVSQSGASAETVRLLDLNRGASILAVTNTPESPLARRAQLALMTQAGMEFSVSCKTYVCAQLALQWLAGVFADADTRSVAIDLAPVVGATERYLSTWRRSVEAMAEAVRGVRSWFLAGRGPSLAAVGTGALIFKESTRTAAEGLSSAAFRHGPLEMVSETLMLLLFTGVRNTLQLNQKLAAEVIARGGRCELIGAEGASEAFSLLRATSILLPMLEILPIELLTLAVSAAAGCEAGKFEHARKITDSE